MAKKTQEWEEIVVKKGDYNDDDSYEEVYPVEDYLKQDYPKKDYPGDYFPKVLQDWCQRQNTAHRHTK